MAIHNQELGEENIKSLFLSTYSSENNSISKDCTLISLPKILRNYHLWYS